MLAIVRSELVRIRRPRLLVGWFGLMALFAILVNTVMFGTTGSGTDLPVGAPGVRFPDAAALAGPDGLVAGLAAASSMFGIVTLSFWALATATDYSSGLIRLLVGKVLALATITAFATLAATAVNVLVAVPSATSAGIPTTAWSDDALSVVLGGWIDAYLAMLVWGAIGVALAVVTRSAAIAISVGVGYVLVVESMIKLGLGGDVDWLLGSTLSSLAGGGSTTMAYATALALGAAYVTLGLAIATVVFVRRDVTD